MVRALLAAGLLVSGASMAQTPPPFSGSASGSAGAAPASAFSDAEAEAIRKEVDARVDAAKKELRAELKEDLKAEKGAATAISGDDDAPVKRMLELLVPDGYLRIRPELFNKFDLNRGVDPWGYTLYPRFGTQRTVSGANMRFRFEPTLNVSEEVRVKTQIDALDNVVLGATPDYSLARSDTYSGGLLSQTIVPPVAGVNSLANSIAVKRVWGEISTPVGMLRFGRMANQWGLGMLHNDGNCIDCDYGETVDRAQFVFEPIPGYFVIPMVDFNVEGLLSSSYRVAQGQDIDITNNDDSHSLVLVLARMDSDAQSRAKLENNLTVFNYGVHFTYRWLKYENTATAANAGASNPFNQNANASAALTRYSTNGALYLPDLWLKYERRKFRFELEGAAALGNMGMPTSNDPDSTSVQNILIVQFGATAQAEVRLLDGALKIGLEGGYASGDKAPGMGQRPNRRSLIAGSEKSNVGTTTGNIDGPQYACSSAKVCADNAIRNFRFARDYRVDMILWREIIGGLTDALYAKPTIAYTITEGLSVSLGVIYSRAVYAASTPSGKDANLGVEFNVGAKYETDDGFYGALNYGLLVPLPGLENSLTGLNLDVAQAVRANVGIRF